MSAPFDVAAETSAEPEAVLAGVSGPIEGRSLGQIAWMRLKRDKFAIAGAIIIVLLVLAAIFAPVLARMFGHPPLEYHQSLIDPTYQTPKGALGGISAEYPLGVEPKTGRDILSRLLYGARYSLLIAFFATLLSVVIGVFFGIVAGYFGGWVDAAISRVMDVFLAFPLLLFAIALGAVVQGKAFGISGNSLRVVLLVFIIGFFSWPYIGRIVRGQTLSLREREFVEAARSIGARSPYILFRELLPNLLAPILVYSTLLIPTNILFEAALSFLGVGIQRPTPSWGQMLSDAVPLYSLDPEFVLVPGMAIFITVLAFNMLGDGLQDALDPRAR